MTSNSLVALRRKIGLSLIFSLLLCGMLSAQSTKIKVIADQDSAGPQGTNFLSLLMLLRAPQIDLLGITTVSGDQWMKPATVFALWATELANRTDVPVIAGAEMPLINTAREQEAREILYGSYIGWHGSFNPDAPKPEQTWAPPGGFPKVKARPGRAADFIIDTIRANPGEVVLYCAGPLTNIALAIRMDPDIVPMTKAIYIMGGSSGGGPELNWWWDPEAAAITMRAPWKQIVVSPFEAGAQVWSSKALMQRVVQARWPADKLRAKLLSGFCSPCGNVALVDDVGRIAGCFPNRSIGNHEIGDDVSRRGSFSRTRLWAYGGMEKTGRHSALLSSL